jgi:signal peptidase II
MPAAQGSGVRRHAVFAALAAASLAADQVAKALVRSSLRLGEARDAAGPLVLRHAENPGIALGIVHAGNVVPVLIVAVIAGLAAVYLAWGGLHWLFVVGCALATAGCAGNLLDRLLRGRVTDFASLGALPVFNVADLLIVSGFLLLLVGSLRADLDAGEPAPLGAAAVSETVPGPPVGGAVREQGDVSAASDYDVAA